LNGPCKTRPVFIGDGRFRYLHGTGAKIFFIIFVDAIFTTLVERLFTSAFDLIAAKSASDCCVARDTPVNSLAT
jgi:hypothetical protein